MKLIGHVSTAVIATSPLIYFRDDIFSFLQISDSLAKSGLSTGHYFIIVGLAATLPDLDIILQRFLPIKHRGFASHSFWTALVLGVLVLLGFGFSGAWSDVVTSRLPEEISTTIMPIISKWCTPFTALLVFLGVFIHILGDSLTVSGVPVLYPKQEWKFPLIGGHARFDNYFLNMIPCVLAVYILNKYFGYGQGFLRHLGSWHNVDKYFRK